MTEPSTTARWELICRGPGKGQNVRGNAQMTPWHCAERSRRPQLLSTVVESATCMHQAGKGNIRQPRPTTVGHEIVGGGGEHFSPARGVLARWSRQEAVPHDLGTPGTWLLISSGASLLRNISRRTGLYDGTAVVLPTRRSRTGSSATRFGLNQEPSPWARRPARTSAGWLEPGRVNGSLKLRVLLPTAISPMGSAIETHECSLKETRLFGFDPTP